VYIGILQNLGENKAKKEMRLQDNII
jgi:hypothetical protein